MKRIILSLFLFFVLVLPSMTVVHAQDASSTSANVSPTPTPTINYQLPYPGLLPDNPLYFLKALRDSMVIFFIADPLKKSEFYLLQSDKRVESAWYLLKEGQQKESLALSTLSKGNNYLFMALDQLRLAGQQGEDTSSLEQSVQQAAITHVMVIKQMVGLVKENKTAWTQELGRAEDLQKRATKGSLK